MINIALLFHDYNDYQVLKMWIPFAPKEKKISSTLPQSHSDIQSFTNNGNKNITEDIRKQAGIVQFNRQGDAPVRFLKNREPKLKQNNS